MPAAKVNEYEQLAIDRLKRWRSDWVLFAEEALGVTMDDEQKAILRSVQVNKMTSVASGTARGKDFTAAVCAVCFLYLTPVWDVRGEMTENTKVALTAPTDRQVGNIMVPEFTRLFLRAKRNGIDLPGRLTGYDIRTDNKEWFLTGFKADSKRHESWSGFHASNTMFVVTEASGIPEDIFAAIEGNLQGNSRILIVFNPNVSTGYAATSQRSPRWKTFRLDSLNAPNVVEKRSIIPGQVDYEWVADKVENWCHMISQDDFSVTEGDFEWEGNLYRPNDLFRVKVRGMFPKVGSDVLVPQLWIEMANERWLEFKKDGLPVERPLRLGVDVAGMGRDSSCFCPRFGDLVEPFRLIHSGGVANHMEIVGVTKTILAQHTDSFRGVTPQAFIDTIGEGAGVYSRLVELEVPHVHSVKGSSAAKIGTTPMKDKTGVRTFRNYRAFLYWKVREWLDPDNDSKAMLPKDDYLLQELTETKWEMLSDGSIKIEEKEEIKKRIGRSPDRSDSLAQTFHNSPDVEAAPGKKKNLANFFR
ncbi:hypothetical protein [Flavihumibacter petaseus]|uniref:Terminase n=1 Tax=Flavihumibacter petaseus NBRC 106054 TaxID=1220578 RepID=A0A0E9N286_9BACT|nr:hypothetical protein [Flavihumibacter petaseus]GAO43781.1 hypothetical protein FPE01S_02_08870 [Flavihumibacter petaseus NBRC 106054]